MTSITPSEVDRRLSLRMNEIEKRYDLHFALNDRAIDKAERTMNTRLDSMNEFRDVLRDQAAKMVTRSELGVLSDQVDKIQLNASQLEGRRLATGVWTSVVVSALVGLVMSWATTVLIK